MSDERLKMLSRIGRWVLLLLLAGLLIGRRDFAHLNLGDLFSLAKLTAPAWSTRAYISEVVMLALVPMAVLCAWVRGRRAGFLNEFGWGIVLAVAFCAYGLLHAVIALFQGGDNYLILRQSALAAYALFFLYTVIFFAGREIHSRNGALAGVAAALLCALLDSFGWLGPKLSETGELMPVYGQETLPLAILGLGYLFVSTKSGYVRAFALAGTVFAGWRQGARPMQSVVPIGMAAALMIMFIFSALIAWRGQRRTIYRVLVCLIFFGTMGLSYRALKAKSHQPEVPGTETASEVKAWDLGQYSALMDVFDRAQMPVDPAARMLAWRPPYVRVDDPEVYKLQAVFFATQSVSVRNNIWRFLVWRRMLTDWREGRTVVGAGVGKPWFYRALYPSGFHYGDDREGLDPHNSYINTLYRYGLIGLAILLSIVIVTWFAAFKALRVNDGDVVLEGLLLYAAYTFVFACFTVSLEGPAYSMPFWVALGLVSSRAKNLRRA